MATYNRNEVTLMKATTVNPEPTSADKLREAVSQRQAISRQVAHYVKKSWCAYYDPDRMAFGNRSRCVKCCVNASTKCYDPMLLDGDCKRSHIICGCLPSQDEAMKEPGF